MALQLSMQQEESQYMTKELIKICKTVNPTPSILEAEFLQALQGRKQATNQNSMKLFFKTQKTTVKKLLN